MDPRQVVMEDICKHLGRALASELQDTTIGPPMGFMLMIFDFGKGGFTAYMSNAQRADVIKLLREQIARMEAGTDATKGQS